MDKGVEPKLEAYVKGVVGAFAKDDRVLGWDVWNEPDNRGSDTVKDEAAKVARVEELLPEVFAWARSVHPMQPLTSGVWAGDWAIAAKESATTKIQLAESDVISFHNYDWPEEFEATDRAAEAAASADYLHGVYGAAAAGARSTGACRLRRSITWAAINWGLVAGKTQTYSAVGFVAAAVCADPADGLVSRGVPAG